MKQPEITVVVPIYKVEKELPRCVESLLHQDYTDFELLLVDDGSPDRCGTICEQYAAQDHRIRVFHQKNSGLSDARNRGTREAVGRYITFVDSDDFILPNFLSTLYQGMQSNHAQISVCGISVCREPVLPACDRNITFCCYSREDALKKILYQRGADVSACAKLYRLETARRFPYPSGRVYEDILTTVQMFCAEQSVAFTDAQLYGYYQRQTSIAHNRGMEVCLDEAEMTRKMLDYIEQNCPQAQRAAICKAYSNYCQIFAAIQKQKETGLYEESRYFLKKNVKQVLTDGSARTKNRAAALLAGLSPTLIALLS